MVAKKIYYMSKNIQNVMITQVLIGVYNKFEYKSEILVHFKVTVISLQIYTHKYADTDTNK